MWGIEKVANPKLRLLTLSPNVCYQGTQIDQATRLPKYQGTRLRGHQTLEPEYMVLRYQVHGAWYIGPVTGTDTWYEGALYRPGTWSPALGTHA